MPHISQAPPPSFGGTPQTADHRAQAQASLREAKAAIRDAFSFAPLRNVPEAMRHEHYGKLGLPWLLGSALVVDAAELVVGPLVALKSLGSAAWHGTLMGVRNLKQP